MGAPSVLNNRRWGHRRPSRSFWRGFCWSIGMEIEKNENKGGVEALTDTIVEAMQDLKAQAVTVIDMEKLDSAPASRFVICEGKSTTQTGSIADNVREQVRKQLRLSPYSMDGTRNSQWVVLDYGSVIAHVFLPEMRSLYDLEELWSDAGITRISDD